ncbi:MAG: PEGA domain-containing protein [Dehalococcoidales bacterium]|nr:PEGA domain-containing protein [Dehalococcoidales bacterium]
MQLPFSVVVEAPSLAELGHLARVWWTWAIAGTLMAASAASLLVFSTPPPEPEVGGARLQVNSVPEAATVAVDGQTRGRTPINLQLPPGEHHVTVRHERSLEATHHVRLEADQTVSIVAELWLRSPQVQRLRPPFPGASIVGADFLRDGRVALAVALPPGDERQLWLVDSTGGMRRLGPHSTRGSLAVSPDGEQVAYFAASQRSGTSTRLDELWVAGHDSEPGERRYVLPANAADERFVDLSWAPDGQHLLLASRQQLPGGGQPTRLRWLSIQGGEPEELVRLPSEIVPGSYNWSPDGERVAFLTQVGRLNSLCVLGIRDAAFHYLGDLSREDANPLPFAPLAWSPNGPGLVHTAPVQDRPTGGGWLFGPKATNGLFAVDPARPVGQRLGQAEGQFPVWRSDGSVLFFARSSGGSLLLRQIEPSGESRDLAELPLKASSRFAVRWNVDHAQALITLPGSVSLGPSQPEYWLVRCRPEVD